MKFSVLIRDFKEGEKKYIVVAKSFSKALSDLGYYTAGQHVRQVLITRYVEPAKVLTLVPRTDSIEG